MGSSLPEFIHRVLSSGLLTPQLVFVPNSGASAAELSCFSLPNALSDLLSWRNGLDLDVIRVHGVGHLERGIQPLVVNDDGMIDFASDPAGFRYVVKCDGTVSCVDNDGGAVQQVAADIDSFFQEFIFGSRAAMFGGTEWATEVAAALDST